MTLLSKINELFKKELKVVNIGITGFRDDLKSLKVPVIHVEFRPPAGGNAKLLSILKKLK
ncbi:fdrA domain protein [Thermovenabulum sp.]|uniref:fdrA domain protein n=1 Tax=Thermovenabulum sp. TaxID=3100335 RepID=UPI003C79E803